jgi:hypothetical protein
MKRLVAVVVLAGVVVGGGVAWAAGADERAARREARRACVDQVRAENPDATRAELIVPVRECMAAAGYDLPPRPQARLCIREAREAHGPLRSGTQPDDREAAIAAARACFEEHGLTPRLTPEQRERRAQFRACVQEAREAHAGDREAMRQAVQACMAG